jgi:hypothetical protein
MQDRYVELNCYGGKEVRQKDNIKIDFREMRYEDGRWM